MARGRCRGKWPTQGKAEGQHPFVPPPLPHHLPLVCPCFLLLSVWVSLALALAGNGDGGVKEEWCGVLGEEKGCGGGYDQMRQSFTEATLDLEAAT